MIYSGWELLWLFFLYSFVGWILETASAAVKQKRFVNRGLINGPLCLIYGFAATLFAVTFGELRGLWLFLGTAILATALEWIVGHLLERLYHEKWWDYSGVFWNLDGYICFPISLLWGALGFTAVNWGNGLLLKGFHLLPDFLGKTVVLVVLGFTVVDAMATAMILSGRSRRIERWKATDAWLDGISSRLERRIFVLVDRRIRRAYPKARRKEKEKRNPAVFADGCSFYKIVMLFFIGAFLGDLTETVFCRITAGVWMSRSSVVWGPFSIVWGLAIGGATALLYRYKDRSDRFLFLMGTLLGGVYEYLCSVFTEIVFGTVFWDYSDIPFNLGGRINLLYCFFWGFAAVVWFKFLYPVFSRWIEKLPVRFGKIFTWVMIVWMCCNIVVSCMALMRFDQRSKGVEAVSGWQMMMDERFDDERMERIYPNAVRVE